MSSLTVIITFHYWDDPEEVITGIWLNPSYEHVTFLITRIELVWTHLQSESSRALNIPLGILPFLSHMYNDGETKRLIISCLSCSRNSREDDGSDCAAVNCACACVNSCCRTESVQKVVFQNGNKSFRSVFLPSILY